MHEVLVNRLGGLPRKSVVRLTERPDMTLDVYRGRKTTTQQQLLLVFFQADYETKWTCILHILKIYEVVSFVVLTSTDVCRVPKCLTDL